MYQLYIQNQMNQQNRPQLRYHPKLPIKESKKGMDSLMNIVLDIKRVSKAIAPQTAAEMIQQHNQKTPTSPWYINKEKP